MYDISEYLEAEARQKVYSAIMEYNEGRGISGMYKLLIGDIGWRVEYQDKGHHLGTVIDAIHNRYAKEPESKVDVIFKETLEYLLANARTLDEYLGLEGSFIDELDRELKGSNSFVIDADDIARKFGELVSRNYSFFKTEFEKVNSNFDKCFWDTQIYVLTKFGVFIEADRFNGKGQLNFLHWYIGGDIEFSDLAEDDLWRMLKDYRECLPKNRGIEKKAKQMVDDACDSFFYGDKSPLKNLLLGIGEGDLTCFTGGGHNYRLIINAMHEIYYDHKESRMNVALEKCLEELICEVRSTYYIKLLANTVMYEKEIENTERGNFEIDIEKLTGRFIENIATNHDQYIMESPDFDKWIANKPVAREKTPEEQFVINVRKIKEQIENEVRSLRRYVGWDKEFDEMSEQDRHDLHSRHMANLNAYEAMIPELTLKVSEAVQNYRAGNKEKLIELLRGKGDGKVEFISGTGHAYRVIIDIMHELYKSDDSCGAAECLDESLYNMAEGMTTVRDIEEMMDLLIYEIEKEKDQSAEFEMNSREISAAMRRNTQDNVESYLPQVSDFYGFQWELKERAKRICGDRIL
ncbi:MAG: hypothetical protein VZR06_13185 [Butyrivibrio sp.]|nr:hypothetical protein [Butyrivibrio sp.]